MNSKTNLSQSILGKGPQKPGSLEISKILSEKLQEGSMARYSQKYQVFKQKAFGQNNETIFKNLDRKM